MALSRGGSVIQQRPAPLGGQTSVFRSIWGGPFSFAKSPLRETRVVATDRKAPVGDAVLVWGKAGTIPTGEEVETPDPTFANFRVIESRDIWTEKQRKTTTERVDNPEDESQYVDVKRFRQGDFKKDAAPSVLDKYSVSYSEVPLDPYWNTVTPDRKVQEVRYILKNESVDPEAP